MVYFSTLAPINVSLHASSNTYKGFVQNDGVRLWQSKELKAKFTKQYLEKVIWDLKRASIMRQENGALFWIPEWRGPQALPGASVTSVTWMRSLSNWTKLLALINHYSYPLKRIALIDQLRDIVGCSKCQKYFSSGLESFHFLFNVRCNQYKLELQSIDN